MPNLINRIKYHVSGIKKDILNTKYLILNTHKRGFTLIEILIAISIISIISAIGINSYSQSQIRARDFRRKQDLRSIQVALELYKQANDHYPCTNNTDNGNSWQLSSSTNWIIDKTNTNDPTRCDGNHPFNTNYINVQPMDPKKNGEQPWQDNKFGYAYYSDTNTWMGVCAKAGQYYMLGAQLENHSDPDRNEVKDTKRCDGLGNWSTYGTINGGAWGPYSYFLDPFN